MKKIFSLSVLALIFAMMLAACGGGGGGGDNGPALSTAKAITAYSFTNPAATGIIDENAKTIAVTVPYGTSVTALVATFTTTGASVKVGSMVQASGTTTNDFTNPVSYVVTAADSTPATYTVTVTLTPPTIPAAPTSLLISSSTSTQINLSWTDRSDNEDGFKIERSLDSGATFTLLTTLATANVTTYSDTGLEPSTRYDYRVMAYNSVGDSVYSNTTNTTTNNVSWAFVDGGGANGINKDPDKIAGTPQLTAFGSKLYAAWYEADANGIAQIRVAVYNGISSPAWSFVDGDGINKDTTKDASNPQLMVFNSKLYATWSEWNVNNVTRIRVAKYNGNDSSPAWTFVDGNSASGINKDTTETKAAQGPQLTVFNSKLYATWREWNASNIYQTRVAVYNGDDSSPAWSFVDGGGPNGINKDTNKIAEGPQLTVFSSSSARLYAMWYEKDASNIYQIRVAVYNGDDSFPIWTFVDGASTNGINKNSSRQAVASQLTVFGSKLYATWYESNASSITQIRVAVYGGNDSSPAWTFVDGNDANNGINKDSNKLAISPQLTSFGSKLYATWSERNASNIYQTRVAVYNGDDSSPPIWTFVDGASTNGINKDINKNAYHPQLTVFGSKLYATWDEANAGGVSQICVAAGQ